MDLPAGMDDGRLSPMGEAAALPIMRHSGRLFHCRRIFPWRMEPVRKARGIGALPCAGVHTGL